MTVAGFHSIAETKELIAAKDFDIHQVQNAFEAFAPEWLKRDTIALADWTRDWNAFQTRYVAAKANAVVGMGIENAATPLVSEEFLPAEGFWNGILRALSRTPGALSKGDFQDLHNRLVAAQGEAIDFSGQPQPSHASDADLKVFQASDSALNAVAVTAGPTLDLGVKIMIGIAGASLLVALLRR